MKSHFCGLCNTEYYSEEDKIVCEKTPLEEPILLIGQKLIEDSYGVKLSVYISEIYRVKHSTVYKMKYEEEEYGIFIVDGNECLIDWFGDQI